jgi:hypothetical protein
MRHEVSLRLNCSYDEKNYWTRGIFYQSPRRKVADFSLFDTRHDMPTILTLPVPVTARHSKNNKDTHTKWDEAWSRKIKYGT